jgi:hypothetical protein
MSAPLLELSPALWQTTLAHLRQQGAGVRESGGFLLGKVQRDRRIATHFLPYEQLQHDALQADFVHDLDVAADVHTHRYGAGQSRSDSENPMLAIAGHLALIVPHFAQGPVHLEEVGLYLYQGAHRWQRFRGPPVTTLITFAAAEDTA